MDDKDSMSAKSGRAEIRAVPDPEVTEKVRRRRFTAAYKSRILKEAELCKQSGQLGALLRREGLYYSNIAKWRRQAESGLAPKKSPEYVRGAALRYARKALSEKDAFDLLVASLRDPNPIVKQNGIDELEDLGNPHAMAYISYFLNDSDPYVRMAAETAMENLRDEE